MLKFAFLVILLRTSARLSSHILLLVRNVEVSNNEIASLINELRAEIRTLREEIKELKDTTTQRITKLTEEVITLKLESRQHHRNPIEAVESPSLQKLPLSSIDDLIELDEEVQKNEIQLEQFVSIKIKNQLLNTLDINC